MKASSSGSVLGIILLLSLALSACSTTGGGSSIRTTSGSYGPGNDLPPDIKMILVAGGLDVDDPAAPSERPPALIAASEIRAGQLGTAGQTDRVGESIQIASKVDDGSERARATRARRKEKPSASPSIDPPPERPMAVASVPVSVPDLGYAPDAMGSAILMASIQAAGTSSPEIVVATPVQADSSESDSVAAVRPVSPETAKKAVRRF